MSLARNPSDDIKINKLPNHSQFTEIDVSGANTRCPHCYKLYRPRTPEESVHWNYCPKGHRTLYLSSVHKDHIQRNLNLDYQSWIPFYKKHHHWIRRIFNDRRKTFLRVLHRDQQNLFELYPSDIDRMIQTAFEIGDHLHRETPPYPSTSPPPSTDSSQSDEELMTPPPLSPIPIENQIQFPLQSN